jgi:hypothetical protein
VALRDRLPTGRLGRGVICKGTCETQLQGEFFVFIDSNPLIRVWGDI